MTATVPGYETTLQARVRGTQLTGEVTMTGSGGVKQKLPFAATLGQTWRFHESALTDNIDVQGRWDYHVHERRRRAHTWRRGT